MPLLGLGVFFILPWQLGFLVYLPLVAASLLLYCTIMRDMHRPAVTGYEGILGGSVEVVEANGNGRYRVRLGGEYWSARSNRELRPGDRAQVTGVQGLVLILEAGDGTAPTLGVGPDHS